MDTSSRHTMYRRSSRVRFDEDVASLPGGPVPRISNIIETQPHRWSVPSTMADYANLSTRQIKQPEPVAYSVSENFRGRFRDPWIDQPLPAFAGQEVSLHHRPTRLPYNTITPSNPFTYTSHARRDSDDTLIGDDSHDKFTTLPPRPTRLLRRDTPHTFQTFNDYNFPDTSEESRSFYKPNHRAPMPLRSAMRRSFSETSTVMHPRPVISTGNVTPNRDGLRRRSRASSISTLVDVEPRSYGRRPGLANRRDSCMSTGSALLDADDPRVTGLEDKKNRERVVKATEVAFDIEKGHKFNKSKIMGDIVHSATDMGERQTFILRLAKALMYFGAPSHRIESQLNSVSRTLELDAQFVHMPSVVICSFGDQELRSSETHFVKSGGRLMLGKLHNVHDVYRSVVRGHMDAQEGSMHISHLLRSPPLYSIRMRCLFAFACCSAICPMAFGGALSDAFISGLGGALLCYLQLVVAHKNALYADVFEISIAIIMSFIARALTVVPGHVFCYQAISSSSVVLILPGYLILCSSLELASKNMLAGSVRMVYAIIYSLFLGFGLTIGSDIAYLLFPVLRENQAKNLPLLETLHGAFTSDNSTGLLSSFAGTFTFTNASHVIHQENPEDLLEGCFRSPNSIFLLQAFPVWTLFLLVPLYSFASALWNLQPVRSRQLPVMVAISCIAYAANKAANKYIFNRSDVVSAIGAFVVGVLGNVYSRVCGGTAFQVMSVGVSFLIPSGIAATGGLSQNYRGATEDAYMAGLTIGLRMVQVGIGITVGLFVSGLVVYSFGSRKKNALFAF